MSVARQLLRLGKQAAEQSVLAIPLWLRDVKVVIHLEVTCSFIAFFESRYCQNSADTMNENSKNPLLIV